MNTLNQIFSEDTLISESGLVPRLDLKKHSKPWSEYCQIEASNDVEAVIKWLEEHEHNKNTYTAYRREALRFLFWCGYVQGKALGELKKEDLEAYFMFLKQPPKAWCAKESVNHNHKTWRPFKGLLSHSAFMTAVRILSSLFNYLVQAEYLRANPIKLIKKYKKLTIDKEKRKREVWKRILNQDEWDAVQNVLISLPERTAFEVDNKMRTQFLFAILYFFGLRIHEVVNHSWGDFEQKSNGQWWFCVKGKGDKTRRVSVNDQLLEFIKSYRTYLKKPVFPEETETEHLLVSQRTENPLKITQLYSLVKRVGEEAAKAFPEEPQKQKKLRKFSPHWMRHLSASHQDKLGFSITMMMDNLGHASRETTQIYVHAEDDERFNQMQKMTMKVEPNIIQQNKKIVGIEYQLRLAKGPINKVMGLSRVLAGIEQVFKGCEWLRVGEEEHILFDKVKAQGAQGEKIELTYRVSSKEVIEAPNVWAEALKRQCEIWLFTVELNMAEIRAD